MSLSLNRFSQLLLRVYQMAEEVLSPEWEIQVTQPSPQTQMSTFYTFHSTKENLQLWYTRRKVYPCISTLKVLTFTRDILQIRPRPGAHFLYHRTEQALGQWCLVSGQHSGHFLRQKFWTESESCHQLGADVSHVKCSPGTEVPSWSPKTTEPNLGPTICVQESQSADTRLWWRTVQHLLQGTKQAEWTSHAENTRTPQRLSGKAS